MLASNSINGLNTSLTFGLATSDIYNAEPTPNGTAMNNVSKVIKIEPNISGNIPNSGGSCVGYHAVPKMNLKKPISKKAFTPCVKRLIIKTHAVEDLQ